MKQPVTFLKETQFIRFAAALWVLLLLTPSVHAEFTGRDDIADAVEAILPQGLGAPGR